MNNGEWKEVDSAGMIKFYQILKVLNCFYDLGVKNKRREFKNQLLKSSNVKIYLRKLNKYSYLVFAEISDSGSILQDDWIHIDGIQEEQDKFRSS
ncbi:LIC_13246 family protein [Leptospira interrogans]|uniref:LIC_13246 family protein n=1 Tax=Leptospira interrogans TaxID=173 RepID=UPI0039C955DF